MELKILKTLLALQQEIDAPVGYTIRTSKISNRIGIPYNELEPYLYKLESKGFVDLNETQGPQPIQSVMMTSSGFLCVK